VPVLSDQPRPLKVSGWPVGRFLRFATWATLVIACTASLALRQADTRYQLDLLPKDMSHNEGAAFQAPIVGQVPWPWEPAPDTMSDPQRSRLILFEDGLQLGPSHQAHIDIRRLGRGRYSHWSNYILFSASDNSDPRTNHRRYHAVERATLSPSVGLLPWLLLLAWAMAVARNISTPTRSRLIRGLSSSYSALQRRIGVLGIFLISTAPVIIFANIIILRHWPMPAAITPDTGSYASFSEARTIGYPGFLKTLVSFFGDLRLLVPIQLNLLMGSILLLGWAVGRLLGNLLVGIGLVLVLALNPALLTWMQQLMTEGLFVPLLLAHTAFVLLLLSRSSRATAAFAGLTLVAAILVRPAAYSLLLNLPLVILLSRDRKITTLAWTIIPAAALYVAAAGIHQAALGTWQSQSFGGFTLLGKVAILIHGDVPGAPPLGGEIYRRIAPQVKDAENKKFPTEFGAFTAELYDPILYGEVRPVLYDYVKRADADSSDSYDRLWRQMNFVAWWLALGVIEQNPLGYLRLIVAQYYGLWSITLTATSLPMGESYVTMMDRNLEQLRQNADLRSWAQQVGLGEDTFRIARAAYFKNSISYRQLDKFLQTTIPTFRVVLVGIAACVVFVFCPFWLWRLMAGRPVEGPSAALLYLGVALNGYYILVASVEFALPRYVEAFEGITLTIDIIALSVVLPQGLIIIPTISSAFRRAFYR
jgi:hypothetical protein